MSAVYTLEQILNRLDALSLDGQAFCRSLLSHGEVLAVQLSYLPEALLWLVTSPTQTRIMRAHQPDCMILTLAEAHDLFTAVGDPSPGTLMEVAGRFATAAPGTPDWVDDEDAGPAEPGDGDEGDYL
ncbi:MAG TPA: hypothetical protein VKH83_07190 [Methylomirabilota bacterium]|nr:hypothetical protein [Methylomirabilota bacterium]